MEADNPGSLEDLLAGVSVMCKRLVGERNLRFIVKIVRKGRDYAREDGITVGFKTGEGITPQLGKWDFVPIGTPIGEIEKMAIEIIDEITEFNGSIDED